MTSTGEEADCKWSISYSGFIEKKSNVLKVWKLRWGVIDANKLMIHSDETENVLTVKIQLTSTTVVEAAEPLGPRKFIIRVYNPEQPTFVIEMSTPDAASMEAWMIALIQSINGKYRESENFCAGSSVDGFSHRSSLILPSTGNMNQLFLSTSSTNTRRDSLSIAKSGEVSALSTIDADGTGMCGYLMKQGRLNVWSRRWIQLRGNTLEYSERSPSERRAIGKGALLSRVHYGERTIDEDTRIVVLPICYEDNQFAFSLVTRDPADDQKNVALRLSAESEVEMYDWITALRAARSAAVGGAEDDDDEEEGCGGEQVSFLSRAYRRATRLGTTNGHSSSTSTGLSSSSSKHAPAFYLNDKTVWAIVRQTLNPSKHTRDNSLLQQVYWDHFVTEITLPEQLQQIPIVMKSDVLLSEMSNNIKPEFESGGKGLFPDSSWEVLDHSSYRTSAATATTITGTNDSDSNQGGAEAGVGVGLGAGRAGVAYAARQYILIEVVESQRYVPGTRKGWNCLNLLPTDPAKLSSSTGVKFPDRYLKRAEPPEGYRWLKENDPIALQQGIGYGATAGESTGSNVNDNSASNSTSSSGQQRQKVSLVDSHRPWSWKIPLRDHVVDDQGWVYGALFQNVRRRYAEGTSRYVSSSSTDVVRQRHWIRVAYKSEGEEEEEQEQEVEEEEQRQEEGSSSRGVDVDGYHEQPPLVDGDTELVDTTALSV